MSRFKRIKNKSTKKSSVSINEKIAALNKELEKTGMLSERMTTSNIYPQTSEVPNQEFNDFEAISQGGYGLGLSGADGNVAGGATIGTLESPHVFAGLTGVALSPPHPITGLRTNATTITDGTGSSYPLVPGSNSGGSYPRGGALWFFDSNYNFGGQQGRWLNFEWSIQNNSWSFWDTNFLGFFFLNPNLDQYVLNGVNIGTQIKNKIAGINFSGNGEIGPPKNILITQRGIGDIEYHGPITPGRLFGLSNQGYNYLDSKSRRTLRGGTIYRTSGGGAYPTTDRTTTFTTGSRLRSAQPVADPTTTTQTQQSPPEESEPPNIPAPESPPDKPFTTPNPTPPPDIPPLPAPKPQPGNYEGRGGRILDPTGLDSRGVELGYNDELYPVNPDRYYTTQVQLAQDILSARMDAEFYSAAAQGYGVSPNYDSAEINNAKANLAKATEMLDNWNRWKKNTGYTWKGAVSDSGYDKQKALEKELKDKELDKQIDQLEKDKAQAEADAEAAATEARNLIAKFGLDVALTLFGPGILKLAGNALGKLPIVAKFFKLSKAAQKAQIDDALRAAKTAKTGNLSSALRGAADDIIDNLDDIIMKTDSSQALKFKDAIIDAVDAGDEQALRRIVELIKNSKFKNQVPTGGVSGKINIPKSTNSNFNQPFGNPKSGLDPGARYDLLMQSYKSKGKLLNEATKLGHFEPEELNVDIEKLRKGIMPEYPKKPPAKMVDGYHQDSKLKPKELNKEPYLKISEKDLIRNHRLKPNEAQEMMKTIDRINDHIKKHPEDLIHAQMRYPVDDPRLAELNWRMDQMLDAGEEYLDSNFKVNDKLFKRAIDRTKNNIKLTDPEYVQQNYNELRGTTQGKIINPKPRDIKLKSKLKKYLPQYESKSFFKHVDSNDYKKISQRKEEQKKLKLANETILNKVTKERQEYIDGEMSKQMSDWRKDISESDFTNITKGNKVSQTFQHTSGATITLDGALGGKMMVPSQVTIEIPGEFGEPGFPVTVDGPTESDFGLAGFTKPLDKKVMQKQSVKTAKEINDQIDASEKASESKSARVPIETGDLGYKSTDEILADVGDQWTYDEYMNQLNALSDRYAKIAEPLEKVKLDYIYNKHEDVPIEIVDAIDAITKALHQAQEALHQAWERYNKVPDLPPVPDEESDDGDGILDTLANKLGKGPSKDVFDNYMNELDKGKLTSKPYNINNILQNDATGNQEIAKLQNMIDDVFLDSKYKTDIDRETEINKRYMDARKTFPNLKNILGQFDSGKKDGIKITRNNNGTVTSIKAKKAFDFTGLTDMAGADVVTGLPAMSYATFKGLPKYFKSDDYKVNKRGRIVSGKNVESPTMNIEIDFKISNKNHKKKNKYDKFGRLIESTAFSKIKKFKNK